MVNANVYELATYALKNEFDPATLDFETTDDIATHREVIGQDRAVKAIDFGLGVNGEGFNIYISGTPGTGRNTTICDAVNAVARGKPVPDDICYLYNFDNPDEPESLMVPAGTGVQLRQDMESLIKDIESEIEKVFSSEDYEKHKKSIVDKLEDTESDIKSELETFAEHKGFTLQQILTGLVLVPVREGHPLTDQQYEQLSDEEKDRIKTDQNDVYQKMYDASRRLREEQRHTRREIQKLDREAALYAIGNLMDDLKRKYSDSVIVCHHLDGVKDDVLNNLDLFKKDQRQEQQKLLFSAEPSREDVLNRYRVNVIVDNSRTQGAPVIVESNPTYYNLTGYVEYRARFGVLSTDFTMVKAGSIHKANGGYLIVQAEHILRDYFVWDSLKKILRYKTVKIENLAQRYGYAPTTGLKPREVPVNLKVVVIGSPYIFQLLHFYDDEFRKLFKVKAEFESSFLRKDDMVNRYVRFIARKAREEKLLAFTRDAVAALITQASREVEHKGKLSARLRGVVDLMYEADYWARRSDAQTVDVGFIKKAVQERIYRSNLLEDRLRELIEEGTIYIDTEGMVPGQINGLAVIQLGDHAFGRPSRITARTFLGKGDIVNIERESSLSGNIHSKGILILGGYLGEKFAQNKILALSASITFEQSYEEVEGDSASSAELYCLLSSLADVPLRQDIAVTGSVNQKGIVQPVGGINEKIEGFYEVCRVKGLTGRQGVLIPRTNVKHLMLKDEVVEAVGTGKFHIYAIDTIDQGIEILTGMEAGNSEHDGNYPEHTVYGKVDRTLSRYAELVERKAAAETPVAAGT